MNTGLIFIVFAHFDRITHTVWSPSNSSRQQYLPLYNTVAKSLLKTKTVKRTRYGSEMLQAEAGEMFSTYHCTKLTEKVVS